MTLWKADVYPALHLTARMFCRLLTAPLSVLQRDCALPTGTATLLLITNPHLLVENCIDSRDTQTQLLPTGQRAVQAISRFPLPLADKSENAVAAIYSFYSRGDVCVIILHRKINTSTWGFFLIKKECRNYLKKNTLKRTTNLLKRTITLQE